MRIGVRLDPVSTLSAHDITDLAVLAEEQGYETVWVPEGIGRDALTQLAGFAGRTERIKLGTGILPLYYRDPTLTAMSAAGMDAVSNHRFILGLGVGHPHMVEGMHGITYDSPITRVREMVESVRQILVEKDVSYQGRFYSLKGATLGPLYEQPKVPIYLAALGPRMIELAGEVADGVLMNWVSPSYIASAIEQLELGAFRAGRDPSTVDVACYIRVIVTEDVEFAWLALRKLIVRYTLMPDYRKFFEQMGHAEDVVKIAKAWESKGRDAAAGSVSESMLRDMAVVGSAEYCRRQVEDFASHGIKMPVIAPFAATDAKGTYASTIKTFQGERK